MQDIYLHISYLLTKHECVIIPGFGAFVQQFSPAGILEENEIFSPPRITLGFNPEVIHNDGLLVSSVQHAKNISYKEASLQVSTFVCQLKETLEAGKSIQFPLIGKLIVSENKKPVFTPASDLSANAPFYGLRNFYMPLLSEIEQPVTEVTGENKAPQKTVSIGKKLWYAAAAAAILLVCLLFATPIDETNMPVQYAGILSPSLAETALPGYPGTVADRAELTTEMEFPETSPDVENHGIETEEPASPADLEIIPEPIQEPVPAISPVAKPTTNYYIVVASVTTREDANRTLKMLQKRSFPKAQILEKNDKWRIYVNKFTDKQQAEKYLEEFRAANPKHADAWLLSSRSPY